ncbi:MAG TPA: sulfotransferase [Kofleriaceae bacterium]|nr:sulfotransferase [Kofleriaceae bacterium]
MTSPTFSVAYILGAGHCGSTLLSMLLNGHSRMLALSELRKIESLLGPRAAEHQPNPLEGALWQRVRSRYESAHGQPFDQLRIDHPSWKTFAGWSRERIRAWAEPQVRLLECIAAESGKDILVDSSKSWQQLYLLWRSGRVPIKVLRVMRDGRAVLHSYNRKYDDFLFSFGQWAKPTAMAEVLRRAFSERDWMNIRYEELATDPTATLTEVCGFLGTEFEPAMLRFRSHPWFGIRGNRMAHGSSEEIRLDEKWRRDLPRRDRLLFELLGGPLNRYHGYRFRPAR